MLSKLSIGLRQDYHTSEEIPASNLAIAISPDSEEKQTSCAAPVLIDTLLFNRQRITTYINQIAQAKLLIQNKQTIAARTILNNLIEQFPNYPDAYVELGDSFVKDKHAQSAIAPYDKATELAPFDISTKIKCTLLKKELSKSFAEFNFEPDVLTTQLTNAKELKEKEGAFRSWYYKRLHYRFNELNINSKSPFTKGESKSTDFQDVSLSNGAVVETFAGLLALENKKYELAEYYFEKAIVKYEYDVVAWGNRIFCMLITNTFKGDELQEVNKIIECYRCPLAYFTRFMLYCDGNEDDLAYTDLTAFLCGADRPELSRLRGYREDVLVFLADYADSEGKIITGFADDNVDVNAIPQALAEVLANRYQGDADKIVAITNTLISRYPTVATNYCSRAILYQFKKELTLASLNFSIAIWLASSQSVSIYINYRAIAKLSKGKAVAADEDFEHALLFVKQNAPENYPKEKLSCLFQFAELCMSVGKQFCANKQYDSAEAIFNLGAKKALQLTADYKNAETLGVNLERLSRLLADLYLECGDVMCEQGKSYQFLKDYFVNAQISYSHWKTKDRQSIGKQVEIYSRKIEKQRKMNTHSYASPKAEIETPMPKCSPAKPINFFSSKPAKPKTSQTVPRFIFEDILPIQVAEIDLQDTAPTQQENPHDIIKRKLEKKLREKAKKLYLFQQRKQSRAPLQESSSDSEDEEMVPVTITKETPVEIESVKFNDFENKIFSLIYALVPEEKRKDYKIFLGGGWAYDKIRLQILGIPENKFNDFDLITNIPTIYLEKLQAIPEVDRLYKLMVDKIKIDVVYEPDLTNLIHIAKSRDFVSLFIDEKEKIYDPTGFGLIFLRSQQLYSCLPPAEIFKEDPLRILRAIYTATKRTLHITTIKKQIHMDRSLLVPRAIGADANAAEKLMHPHRFNIWIGKLFSQHLAVKNFAQMKKFNLFDSLFPDIADEILTDYGWLENQVLISNNYAFPQVAIIYASFIASAIAQRTTVIYKDYQLQITQPLKQVTAEIYNNSLLFKDAFKDLEDLFNYLQRTLLEWGVQHEHTAFEAETMQPASQRLIR